MKSALLLFNEITQKTDKRFMRYSVSVIFSGEVATRVVIVSLLSLVLLGRNGKNWSPRMILTMGCKNVPILALLWKEKVLNRLTRKKHKSML